jgi:hypothetical protein
MGIPPSRFSPNFGAVARIALAVGVGALGVLMAHYPMIFSGFRRLQTDLQDVRLIHYLLEHGYLWMRRVPAHLDFWSPPFFYPARDVAAYSDVILSVGPVYWVYRILGASPDLSFGLWLISMSVLNYAAGLLFFRKGLGFGIPAAVAGSALLAFGAPRLNQLYHPQLLPFFFPLLSLFALSRLAIDKSLGSKARAGYWMLAMAGLVAQLYTGVYLGWFSIVGLGLAAAVSLAMPAYRGIVVETARRDVWAISAAGATAALLLIPFLAHYLPAAREVGPEFILTLRGFHPSLGSWFDVGANHWLWGWTAHPGWAGEFPVLEGEHHLGMGFLTPLLCAVGLYLGRAWPICRLAAAVAFVLWFTTTYMPGDEFATLAAWISYYCAAGLFLDVDETAWRAAGLVIVVCLLLMIPFPNPHLVVLGLSVIIYCVLEIGRVRARPRSLIAPGIALALLSWKIFHLETILHGSVIVALIAALPVYYGRTTRRELGVGCLALLVALLMLLVFLDQPQFLAKTLAGTVIALAVNAPRQYRPAAWLLLKALVVALVAVLIFYTHDSLWLAYSNIIPGAVAIRAVGRVVLVILVPAALGLAALVEFLDRRRCAVLSWLIILVCLAEQGVTNPSFDAAANRAAINNLADRIDRTRVAFFYHPDDGQAFHLHHLDAMWASLAAGVPTINGYSGHAPRAWQDFFNADFDKKMDMKSVLAKWERTYALPPDQVQWIGPNDRAPGLSENR